MDVTMREVPSIQFDNILNQLLEPQRDNRHCTRDSLPGEFPLAYIPTMVLHILTSYNLDPVDLARLEATCTFFRQPTKFIPEYELSLSEVAALEMCQKRAIFKSMKPTEREELRERCGGSWKLVLRFLLAGEACYRREKSQVIAGDKHSVVVTSGGDVYTFGINNSGQLGHSTTNTSCQPQKISSLKGIRIIQATAGLEWTMLVSDSGQVYAFGKDRFGLVESRAMKSITAPKLMESLKGIFVVQAVIGGFFTAVLSREGRVYTFCWGNEEKLGHGLDREDTEPRPLNGALENVPVVQIGAGYCYLLALAFQPSGMSVYSVGCGKGGKLGHDAIADERQPRLIKQFEILNIRPVAISAGMWHAAVLGHDGRVCTWGWSIFGCLGHGNEQYQATPKVVDGLGDGKAVHVATGDCTTFVVLDNGDIYSFGAGWSGNLGHEFAAPADDQELELGSHVLSPKLVTSLKELDERVVQVSLTNTAESCAHTIVLTESGNLFSFGRADNGQLGAKLSHGQVVRQKPGRIHINLS